MPDNIGYLFIEGIGYVEVFHSTDYSLPPADYEPGFYWWPCLPGCLPDSDAFGPFARPDDAYMNARGDFE